MRAFVRHIRFAWRALDRERGATFVAVASLALAIAANATIFSLVEAVEFPRLIYPDAERLVFLESAQRTRALSGLPVSAPDVADVAAASRTLRSIALIADQTSIAGDAGRRTRWDGRRVTPTFFETLGVAPALGRLLSAGDRDGVIVLSHDAWRALGGDSTIVGRDIRLDGGTVTVVGVMPPRFDPDADFWTPLASTAGFARDDRQLSAYTRLAPGASLDDATRELSAIADRLADQYPATNAGWTMFPVALRRQHGRDSRGAFLLLQGAVTVVLLIACANIANILLARGARRRHEMAVRLSLGATRRRLLTLLLNESLVLSCIGGAIGMTLALWGIRTVRWLGGFPDVIAPSPNALVVAFTAGVTALTGVLCGIVPALRASATEPRAALTTARGAVGQPRRWLRTALVAVQVSCAVVLGTCGLLLVQSMANRERVDLGFDPERSVQGGLALDGQRYDDPQAVRAAVDDLLAKLAARSPVEAAGAITWALPTPAGAQRQFSAVGVAEPLPPGVRRGVEAVTPGYFAAMGIRVTAGRPFNDGDGPGALPVTIVNEELAKHLWADRAPVGQQLRLGSEPDAPVATVVGVVRSLRRSAMHDVIVARAYVPFAQYPNRQLTLVVRAGSDAAPLADTVRSEVARVDPMLMVERLRTTAADLADFLAPLRMMTWLLAGFAAAAALLTALGVYGTLTYSVAERQRELAVRAALGADGGALVRVVFMEGARIALAGLIPGVVLALLAARLLAAFLFGVPPGDPATVAMVVVLLALVSLAACVRPARIAATTDPMTVLRRE